MMRNKIRKVHRLYKAVKIGKLEITSIIEDQKGSFWYGRGNRYMRDQNNDPISANVLHDIDRRKTIQFYYDAWDYKVVVCRAYGKCKGCGSKLFAFDEGGNDPRGVLGDHVECSVEASEYGMVGKTIPACFYCMNDEHQYNNILSYAYRKVWKDKNGNKVAWKRNDYY